MSILGVGTDVVDIPTFAEQLNLPGSRLREVFTARERRRAKQRAAEYESAERTEAEPAGENRHLAAVWAMKEAFIKAWSGALAGIAPPLSRDQVRWPEIEVRHDAWGRPRIALEGTVLDMVAKSLGLGQGDALPESEVTWHASASHDGDFACALVVLEKA